MNINFRFNKFGVVDLSSGRIYNNFKPFILASQADQVIFIPYPRLIDSRITWLSAIKVTPRGCIVVGEEPPLHHEMSNNEVDVHKQQTDDILLIDLHNREFEDLLDIKKRVIMKLMYMNNKLMTSFLLTYINDMMDEACEDEFDESDHCSDDDKSNDESEYVFLFGFHMYINLFNT